MGWEFAFGLCLQVGFDCVMCDRNGQFRPKSRHLECVYLACYLGCILGLSTVSFSVACVSSGMLRGQFEGSFLCGFVLCHMSGPEAPNPTTPTSSNLNPKDSFRGLAYGGAVTLNPARLRLQHPILGLRVKVLGLQDAGLGAKSSKP